MVAPRLFSFSLPLLNGVAPQVFFWRNFCRVAFLLHILLLFPAHVFAEEYRDALIFRSKEKNISNSRNWKVLLHYEDNWIIPGVESRVDVDSFFLAANGKTDPQAELEATIKSFFSKEVPGRQHPRCAFIARYNYLKSELGIDEKQLPINNCKEYQEWKKALDPVQLTLVFPASFVNNPASMFGHTLLRLDARGIDENGQLLSYATNYSAETDTDSGFLYAAKGLLGGYYGFFAISPYYGLVKKYNDLEKRDIWEYELNFSQDEINRLTDHLWELRKIGFKYFYFDENCSFHLLALLEVARPELMLTDKFPVYAIPTDTIREILKTRGILKRATFRPSLATNTNFHLLQLKQAKLAKELASGKVALTDRKYLDLTEKDKPLFLDTAYEYLQFAQATGKISPESASKTAFLLLKERSLFSSTAAMVKPPTPETRPDKAHGSSRAAIKFGSRDRKLFSELNWRASYHDLLDPEAGFVKGAQIELFELSVRQEEEQGFKINRVMPVNVFSLAADDAISNPWAWKIRASIEEQLLEDRAFSNIAAIDGGFGVVGHQFGETKLYALIAPEIRISENFKHSTSSGLGTEIGTIFNSKHFSMQIEAEFTRFGIGSTDSALHLRSQQRVMLGKDFAFNLSCSRNREFDKWYSELSLGTLYYF
jgi:Domain of unknown function (DUF4105)